MRNGSQPASSPGGFALLIVLWSVVLMALLATRLTAAGRSDLQLAGNIWRAAAAVAAADGGVAAAEFHIATDDASAWQADGEPHRLRIGRYTVTVQVMDENRKVNPNYAEPVLLAALLVATGIDPVRAATLANSIAEWVERGPRNPIVQRYRSAGMAAAPTGNPFQSVTELGLVIGMTPDLLDKLAPHLSVYATGEPDMAHADAVVQTAMRSLDHAPPVAALGRPNVFEIVADARADDGSRFARYAIVARGRQASVQPFQALLWKAAPAR